jgi:hypothetical protein
MEILREYRNILLGHNIVIFTNHKKPVLFEFHLLQRSLPELMIEGFGPGIQYIKESHNTVADAPSRLPCSEAFSVEKLYAGINMILQMTSRFPLTSFLSISLGIKTYKQV